MCPPHCVGSWGSVSLRQSVRQYILGEVKKINHKYVHVPEKDELELRMMERGGGEKGTETEEKMGRSALQRDGKEPFLSGHLSFLTE